MVRFLQVILTLALDERSFAFFAAQRRRYFPPERNLIPAHLTLFHKLPAAHEEAIVATLACAAAQLSPMTLDVTGLRSLGRGVAYVLSSPALARVRSSRAVRATAA